MGKTQWTALLLLGGLIGTAVSAADWPQWRGPDRTGLSRETGLLKAWPTEGPKLAWKATGLGEGYSAPSIVKGRVYGMGLRGGEEVVWALDEKTGKEVWHTRIAAGAQLQGTQGGNGPRSTPTVDGTLVYALGASGDLACLNVSDGKPRWKKSLVADFGGRVPTWGYSESPLVEGEKVIVTPGGSAATLVALNKSDGEVIWKSQVPSGNNVAYSSCIVADVDGQKEVIQFLAGGVVGVAAKDGRFLWRYNSPANRQGINCSTPIYRDHLVFAASAYGNGGGAARLTSSGGNPAVKEIYFTRQMQNHHGGVVLVGDYLYGFDNNTLTCIEFKTGKIMWTDRSVGKGSVTYADGYLYARSERGPVALVIANPKAYVEKGRFEQPNRTGNPSWSYPVIANGKLYLRDQEGMLCYDIKP
jgi:outer membrane protein assembly factor BamB